MPILHVQQTNFDCSLRELLPHANETSPKYGIFKVVMTPFGNELGQMVSALMSFSDLNVTTVWYGG
jgi:hypothetical protein